MTALATPYPLLVSSQISNSINDPFIDSTVNQNQIKEVWNSLDTLTSDWQVITDGQEDAGGEYRAFAYDDIVSKFTVNSTNRDGSQFYPHGNRLVYGSSILDLNGASTAHYLSYTDEAGRLSALLSFEFGSGNQQYIDSFSIKFDNISRVGVPYRPVGLNRPTYYVTPVGNDIRIMAWNLRLINVNPISALNDTVGIRNVQVLNNDIQQYPIPVLTKYPYRAEDLYKNYSILGYQSIPLTESEAYNFINLSGDYNDTFPPYASHIDPNGKELFFNVITPGLYYGVILEITQVYPFKNIHAGPASTNGGFQPVKTIGNIAKIQLYHNG
jgi:hypothetical protein